MKAWYLSTRDGDDGSFIVFAENRNAARAQANIVMDNLEGVPLGGPSND